MNGWERDKRQMWPYLLLQLPCFMRHSKPYSLGAGRFFSSLQLRLYIKRKHTAIPQTNRAKLLWKKSSSDSAFTCTRFTPRAGKLPTKHLTQERNSAEAEVRIASNACTQKPRESGGQAERTPARRTVHWARKTGAFETNGNRNRHGFKFARWISGWEQWMLHPWRPSWEQRALYFRSIHRTPAG